MAKKRRHKRSTGSLILGHLGGIRRALLEGEKRPAFLAFLESNAVTHGIYALYDKKGRLYYSGKASDLTTRLNQHLRDRHGESWELMTFSSPRQQTSPSLKVSLWLQHARRATSRSPRSDKIFARA